MPTWSKIHSALLASARETKEAMSSENLLGERSLPVRLIGYDRRTVDELLRRGEEALAALSAERDGIQGRLTDAESELADYRAQQQAISSALVAAQHIEHDASREAELLGAEAKRVADSLVADVQARAVEIVAAAERKGAARAAEIVAPAEDEGAARAAEIVAAAEGEGAARAAEIVAAAESEAAVRAAEIVAAAESEGDALRRAAREGEHRLTECLDALDAVLEEAKAELIGLSASDEAAPSADDGAEGVPELMDELRVDLQHA